MIKKIFGNRYKDPKKYLIVDEVDNMCLDRARNVLYLSHEIQGLKWLETLFINIWAAVLRVEINNSDDMSSHIEDISKFMKQSVQNKNIYVPDYLHSYDDYKIKRWVDSVFQARIMREDDHFVLDVPKTDGQSSLKNHKTIIVVDKDTGVEQYSTRWSNGLAQFLELRYRRKISVESLKAVFISNKTFFQRYKECLYGLTGTLGSENSQSFLADLYNVQFADLPTWRKKCYFQIPSKVAFEYSAWLDLIAKETIEQSQKRPVLIICENVEATENIWSELIRHSISPHTIAKYRRKISTKSCYCRGYYYCDE
jgi:preprotein translocase subunit SecA